MGDALEGPEPLHKQIAGIMRRRIQDGTYRPNQRVPSESELCDEFDVSRRTVRAAYAILAEEELIVTSPGRGTFVRVPPE
ncbi:winged helix-turn-helix domain-containing protein [Streptomonospora litoralis]|uniref:Putative HTH-type transcriptional regulator YurK n=1 Tax=Streptomonospora litoralis TaxID=2498135 RepID=A0A4P6Q2R7_9ACTN|nr:winged helix-turn-helix domain-containing protein [Streptomonospora litoralis]QBI54946.1 putative HTH-type transcriptional regulator YurK [Streptomonospora litoralis]